MAQKIYIGADHRGFEQKVIISEFLQQKGYEVIDKGAYTFNSEDDYPDFAFAVAEEVSQDQGSKGILLCGSSIGVCVAANKVNGIFASQVRSPEEAKEDIEHHNTNVVCLTSDHLDVKAMKDILEVWLNSEFQGGRHQRRLDKIWEYEKTR